ncbi:MAG: glycosyltransferase [Methanobrevibacter sp.]|jgi:glycosyltransferase involved in cell wall biosynthesis|nr:glycosyltransferase [Candidatus Methanovirga basalitermitum]
METKISVIIPVYNREDLLKRSVESVINQSIGFENIELIIVDNKSTDNTRTVMKAYKEKYDNVTLVFREENSGSPNIPRNNGIEIAKSKYVMFLDSDDTYNTYTCEYLYDAIEENDVDFADCWSRSATVNNLKEYSKHTLQGYTCHTHTHNNVIYGGIWNKIYKKSFLDNYNIRFLDHGHAEDVYFSLLSYAKVNKWLEVKYVGYFHYLNNNSLTLDENFSIGVLEGIDFTYRMLEKEKPYLNKISLEGLHIFLLPSLKSSKNVINIKKYGYLFKKYDDLGLCDDLSLLLKILMKIASHNFSFLINLSSIIKKLKINNILENRKIKSAMANTNGRSNEDYDYFFGE